MNTKEIIDGYLGNTQVNSIYQGSELIWYRFDINLFAYGVKQDLSGNGQTLTRVGNLELHKTLPIQSKMRGCLLNDNGTVNYYLSNNSDLLKEDGITPSVLNGTDGNVMTEIPAFYVLEKDEGGFAYRYISEVQLPGFRYIPKQYIGRYEAAINRSTGKLMSIINNSTTYRGGNNTSSWDGTYRSLLGRPCTDIDRSTYRIGARMGRSSKWNISTTLTDYTIQLLFITEYATYNSQATFNSALTAEGYKQGGLGTGVTNLEGGAWNSFNGVNPFIPCGYTSEFGNRTGVKDHIGTLTTQVNRYRGIELPFGHIWKYRDGCVIELSNNYTIAKYYIFDNPDNYADTKTVNARYLCDMPSENGYIKRFNKYVNIASTIGGSSGSWGYDYANIKNDGAGTLRGFLSGGDTANGSNAGLGFSSVVISPTTVSVYFGARLTYCDENIIIQTVDIPIVSLVITGGTEVVAGNTLQLGIAYTPSNTTQQGVMWSSSDETKAIVDSNGLVTTISGGTVTITATSISNSSITDTHNIIIEIPIVAFTATGGTITTYSLSGKNYKCHTFTGSGEFVVTSGSKSVEYLIVGGGGGSRYIPSRASASGGGGGGAMSEGITTTSTGTYNIIVGAGGSGDSVGGSSSFNNITSIGASPVVGYDSGGSCPGGYSGGNGQYNVAGGGGGMGSAGQGAITSTQAGNGGSGKASSITGSSKYYSAGGGGAVINSSGYSRGWGGSGIGGNGAGGGNGATNGVVNTGAGGGGSSGGFYASNGGSGIIIIRYEI